MGGEQLHKIFVKTLSSQTEGHAVYQTLLARDFKPGTCGYVDENGDFNTILQLTGKPELAAMGVKAKDDGATTDWTPKVSSKMHESHITLDGKLVPPGTAVGAKAGYEYTNQASNGAVLIAYGAVTTSRLQEVKQVRRWMNDNIESLVRQSDFETIQEKGIWVVTKTYSARRRRIAVMSSKGQSVAVHTGVRATNAVEMQGSMEWWDSEQSTSGWITNKSNKGEKGVILFFTGIWWKPGHWYSKPWVMQQTKEKQSTLDGNDEEVPAVYVEDEDPKTEERKAEPVLQLLPGLAGCAERADGSGLDGLPTHDDFGDL